MEEVQILPFTILSANPCNSEKGFPEPEAWRITSTISRRISSEAILEIRLRMKNMVIFHASLCEEKIRFRKYALKTCYYDTYCSPRQNDPGLLPV